MLFGYDNKSPKPVTDHKSVFEIAQNSQTVQTSLTVDELADLKAKVQKEVMVKVDPAFLGKYREADSKQIIKRQVLESIEQNKPGLPLSYKETLVDKLTNEISGYGILEQFLDDPEVTEILVEAYNKITLEKFGDLEETDVVFNSEEDLRLVLDRIIMPLGRRLDMGSPTVNARLSDGSRISAIAPPAAPEGLELNIRKFKPGITLDNLIEVGAINETLKNALIACVKGRLTIFVSGGTGSGKSTFLNALSSYVDPKLSIITIEDPIELQFKHPHVRRWEAKPANIDGTGAITPMFLVEHALRSRPDIIIVGEVRGKEAHAMIRGVRTGHPGSMTTGHADTPDEAMEQVVSMVSSTRELSPEQVPKFVSGGLDLIIQLNRMPDRSRKLTQIAEIIGEKDGRILTRTLVKFEQEKYDGKKIYGKWVGTGEDFTRKKKLEDQGIDFPGWE